MKRTIWIVIAFMLLLPVSIATGQQEEPAATREAKRLTEIAEGKAVLSCPGCDLQGVNFSGFNLSKANLVRANLAGANLSNTRLDDADLSGADLRGANLDGMTCARCDFSGAQLDRISLKGAKLDDADLQFADIAPAQLESLKRSAGAFDATLSAIGDSSSGAPWACGYSDLSKVTKRIHVSTTGNDGDSCGATPETACRTIAQGIKMCKAEPAGCAVLVAFGEYKLTESLQLAAGIDLHGGCIPSSTPPKKDLVSLIRGADGYSTVLSTSTGPKTIQGFEIFGSDSQIPGGASMAVYVTDRLTVLNSRIVAGNGKKGADGGNPGAGSKGGDGSERTGGRNPGAGGFCPNTQGGDGGSTRTVSVETYWDPFPLFKYKCIGSCAENCDGLSGGAGEVSGAGQGGGRGGDNCAECPVTSAGTGVLGGTGTNGTCGGGGASSTVTMGVFQNSIWRSVASESGQRGKAGAGGGGGGNGGYFAGWCFRAIERYGGRGGGGGAGGCGGSAGGGGQQGGASIAILLVGGQLTIKDSKITAGRGGDGGKGGNGNKGGAGGSGAAGAGGDGSAGTGGRGGDGGAGGSSGGGAGGNGGPSIGIALSPGTPAVVESNVTYLLGDPGTPGKKGTGGASTVTGGCSGTDGQDGKASSAVQKHQF